MIIKTMDSKQDEIQELSSLLDGNLTPNQRFLIERELKSMKNGIHGEEDAAYYIDFYFKESKNWAVIHDLRIEHEDQVAQIDHILMNRLFDMYILESKNYSYKVAITPEGEFQVYYGKDYHGIASPIEQNKRHIHLLERFLKAREILPTRLGISIPPKFKNFILISPKSIIHRPSEKKFDTGMVIKADTLRATIDKEFENISTMGTFSSIGKMSSSSTIEEVARRLVRYHRPHKMDWRGKFGLPAQGIPNNGRVPAQRNEELGSQEASKYFCFKCKKTVSEKVATFCFQNKSKFGGRAYCFDCQRSF